MSSLKGATVGSLEQERFQGTLENRRRRNGIYCVGWSVKLYSLTRRNTKRSIVDCSETHVCGTIWYSHMQKVRPGMW